MKAMVAVKRVPDSNVRVRVRTDGSGVELAGVKMSLNPYDEIALEEAIRQRERGALTEVVAVTCGPAASKDVLVSALAMGADRAVLIQTDEPLHPLAVASLLHAWAKGEQPQLVLLGKQAIDDDCNQTGQMLAAMMGCAQATAASTLVLEDADGAQRWQVQREIDGGTETVALSLPAVLTADLRLAEPRYITLPALMKAKKRPIEPVTPQTLGVDVKAGPRIVGWREPQARSAGIRLADASEFARHVSSVVKAI